LSATAQTILVVEDHPLVAKFYRMALERVGGYACLVTEDLDEILAAVRRGGIALALLDISLRGTQRDGKLIDGVELARLLKQHAPAHLPILLATAYAMEGDRERLLAASGADGYLQKPIYDAQYLVDTVKGLLSKPL
jgi:two-component system, cell cycle response regulator DivK